MIWARVKGIDMNKKELLDTLVEKNLGYLKTEDALNAGVSRTYAAAYVKTYDFERVVPGLYLSKDAWPDPMYVIQYRYKDAVFSHETALYLLNMAEREPTQFTVTLETGKNSARLQKDDIKVYKVKPELHSIGISGATTTLSHTVRTYNAERTIVDLLRSRNNIESQDFYSALKEYVARNDKNVPQLMRYAEAFSVSKIARQYLEVLL